MVFLGVLLGIYFSLYCEEGVSITELGSHSDNNDKILINNQSDHSAIQGNRIYRALNYYIKISFNNLCIGIMLSFIGFFTGGVLTCAILIYNGFNITLLVNQCTAIGLSNSEIVDTMIYHGIIEIFALVWLGSIGLGGYFFMRDIYKKNIIPNIKLYISFKESIIPFCLIAFAAIIETLYGYINQLI